MKRTGHMTKSRKKKRNKYKESRIKALKAKVREMWPVLAIFAGFCLVILLGAGLTRLYHALLKAPWLQVEEINVAGLKKLDRTQVLDAMGVSRGECILNLRMSAIADRLKKLPNVKSAAVRLDLPGRIVAEVSEREPVALVKGSDYFLVDEEGLLLARASAPENPKLPLVTGICGSRLKVGDRLPVKHVRRLKELTAAFAGCRNWLPASSVVECRWEPGGYSLILGERKVAVEIGKEDFSRKFARLKKVIDTLNERQWNELVTRIDLDVPGKAYLEGRFPVPKTAQGQARS